MIDLFNNSLGIAGLVVVALVIIYFISPKPGKKEPENDEASKELSVTKEEENLIEKDTELIAAVMGALSSYLEVPASKLKIKSIKRSEGSNSSWRREALKA